MSTKVCRFCDGEGTIYGNCPYCGGSGFAPVDHKAAICAAAEAWVNCGSAENERALLRAVRASRGDAGHLSLAADFIALLVGLSVLAVAAVNGPWWLTVCCAVAGIAWLFGFGTAADEHGAIHEHGLPGPPLPVSRQPSHVRVLCDEGGCGLEEGHESGHLHDWETDGEKSA